MSEMTPAELRLAIAKAKGIPIAIARTHDFKHGFGPERMVNAITGKSVPDWPADIAAAWELIDELDNSRVDWQLSNVVPSSDSIVYEFHIIDSETGAKKAYGCDETAPLAICRAWLAWKGLDK